jgi:hypothetical protein
MPKRKGLFAPADDWQHNACINYLPDSIHAYADGYKEAAEIVVGHAISRRAANDTLVYPILFLYRHYLELRLKELIASGSVLIGKRIRPPADHRLDNIWGVCRPILKKISPQEPANSFKTIGECIKEFARFDASSQSFRYSRSRNGQRSLEGVTHINLRNVRDTMSKVSGLLDGASMAILEYRTFRP